MKIYSLGRGLAVLCYILAACLILVTIILLTEDVRAYVLISLILGATGLFVGGVMIHILSAIGEDVHATRIHQERQPK